MTGGGYNEWLLYRVNNTGTAYVVKNATGSATATSPSDAVIELVQLEGVKFDFDANGGVKVGFEQHQAGGLFDTFLNTWAAVATASGGVPEVKFIDGASSQVSTSDDILLLVAKGAVDEDDDTKRLTRLVLCTVDPTSGSEEVKHATSYKPALILNSVKAAHACLVDEALFGSGYSATPGDQTIAVDKHFLRCSLLKA